MIKSNKGHVTIKGREDVVFTELSMLIRSLAEESVPYTLIAIKLGLGKHKQEILDLIKDMEEDK